MSSKLDIVLFQRTKAKDWNGQPVQWCEQKLDGHRMTFLRDSDGIRAFGRKETLDLWPDLEYNKPLRDKLLALPFDTALDGELVALGGRATEVVSRIKHRCSNLEFFPFAMPMIDGVDTRDIELPIIRSRIESAGFTVPNRCSFIPDYRVLAARARDENIEGYVLKLGHYRGWYKVKPVRSVDAVVHKVKPGKGRFVGMIGSLVVKVLDEVDNSWKIIADVGTGLTDDMRCLPEAEYVDKVVEVQYDSVGANGLLRFPVLLRVRDDKQPEECFHSQLF